MVSPAPVRSTHGVPGAIAAGGFVADPALSRHIPLGRIGRPEDLEGIVVYLASDLSRYHSGDTITLDGGLRAQNH